MATIYAADGVDVKEGDSFSAFAGRICSESYHNSPFVKVHDLSQRYFRGPRSFTFQNLPKGYTIDAAPDGIGTKVIIISAVMTHRKAARDLIAMTSGDISRFGGLPLVFINVLDVKTLGKSGLDATMSERMVNRAFRDMLEGLGEVCKEQKLVAFKGETAELGVCVGSENPDAMVQFNWAGIAIGVYHPGKMITGDSLMPGQQVVALKEEGFRSNGISSVRKAFQRKFGPHWYRNPEAAQAMMAAAKPSILYDRFLCDANGWFSSDFQPKFKIHLIVHITGGAICSKFAKDILFPRGLSAKLDGLWKPPVIMRQCAEWRGMGDVECYETWNGGQGVLVVVDQEECEGFITHAQSYGIPAKQCGEITREKTPKVVVYSKFNGEKIVFFKK